MSFAYERLSDRLIRRLNYYGSLRNPCPTFKPSMNIRTGPGSRPFRTAVGEVVVFVCHYNLTAGNLVFHPDCTHAFRKTTVRLPEIPFSATRWGHDVAHQNTCVRLDVS